MNSLATSRYNMQSPVAPVAPYGSGASNGAVSGSAVASILDTENPALWLLGIGAVTLGLIAVNASFRVGPLHGSAGVGKK